MALRIGIVGTGGVAQRNYIPFLAQQPDVSLGYFNRTAAKAEAAAAEHGGQVFPSIEALMAWGPDTVFVLTRETDRYEAISALLDHDPRRLFFEKPLVARQGQAHVSEQDFFDARELMRRVAAQGCQTAMIFNYRFFDQSLAAKRLIAEREFGRAVNLIGLVHYACWSHAIDLVHYYAGPIAEISALDGKWTHQGAGMESCDIAAAFRTEGQATGTLIGTSGADFRFPLTEMILSFESGRIHMRGLDGDMEVLDYHGNRHELFSIVRDRSRWNQYDDSFKKSIAAYLDSLRTGQEPPVPGIAGLQELQVEAGMRRSAAQGRPVVLADEFPLE
ncbi:MAG: Gfo/Idh/MocA family oxidoreductase [Anaerolineales bacterium]|nr:Gfo/Idh/MocA family oxidoreductase [Anaerolineales bacterium]